MLFELLAVVLAGVSGGGVAAGARRLVRRLPRWLVPLSAGGTMLVAAVALEYAWFERTRDALPERVEVALTHESRAPWRPWTYAAPYVDRFAAIDRGSVLTHPAAPHQRIADVLLFARWVPPQRVRSVFDCEGGRRAPLAAGVGFGPEGAIEAAAWFDAGPEDPLLRAACAGA